MAKAKFNEAAEKYAKPHTMSGKEVNVNNAIPVKSGAEIMKEMNISSGVLGKGNFKAEKAERQPLADQIEAAFAKRQMDDYADHDFPKEGAIEEDVAVKRFAKSKRR